MTTAVPEPLEIKHEKAARRVTVSWDDGHVSVYPIDYLRSWCPCATCQGHQTSKYLDRHGEELQHLEAVGNYAVTFTWGDAHDTGIYSFRLLRGLCPCDDCGGERR